MRAMNSVSIHLNGIQLKHSQIISNALIKPLTIW